MKENNGLKIVVIGMAGTGKTTLANELSIHIQRTYNQPVVRFNADEVRSTINSNLGFSMEDRIHQAMSMGWLADQVANAGAISLCDFICPTRDTLELFETNRAADFIIWHDRITQGRFEDTNKIYQTPHKFHLKFSEMAKNSAWSAMKFLDIHLYSNQRKKRKSLL